MSCKQKIPERLWFAMQYSMEQKGKRLRPLLTYATALCLGAKIEEIDSVACAVEFVHIFSLIHDDLPSMDNDDYRRGVPTCHKKFDEATAILAGDALITQISDLIFYDKNLDTQQKLNALHVLLNASGPYGMIGGQMLDIQQSLSVDSNISQDYLLYIYNLKTGALFKACINLGYICANCNEYKKLQLLEQFIYCFGLAFQIRDDLEDIINAENNTLTADILTINQPKLNYAYMFGIHKAQEKIAELINQAEQTLNAFNEQSHDNQILLLKQFLQAIKNF